jgi:vacuolar-type H+-ATPase subunit E/Vma4
MKIRLEKEMDSMQKGKMALEEIFKKKLEELQYLHNAASQEKEKELQQKESEVEDLKRELLKVNSDIRRVRKKLQKVVTYSHRLSHHAG